MYESLKKGDRRAIKKPSRHKVNTSSSKLVKPLINEKYLANSIKVVCASSGLLNCFNMLGLCD